MPALLDLASQYFWAIALALSALNYFKTSKQFAAVPHDGGARKYLNRLALGLALPWVCAGIGQLTGVAPTVWHYFRPQDGNPFVWAWLALYFGFACIYAWWVLLAGGASKVHRFNLITVFGPRGSKSPPSEFTIKMLASLGLLFFPVWVYVVVNMNARLP
jgi:hypothetical protein